VAQLLVKKNYAKPVFLAEDYSNITLVSQLDLTGIEFLNKTTIVDVLIRKIGNRLKKIQSSKLTVDQKKKQLSELLEKRLKQCRKYLLEINPVSIVLRGDRHLGNGWEPALIKAGKELSIPRIVINYAYPTFVDDFINKRRRRSECDADLFSTIKEKYPQQYVFDEQSKKNVLYRPAYSIEAMAENGMLPENPWVMGGSGSSLILIDGEFNKKLYLKHGVPEEKILVTGVGAHDKLFDKFFNKEKIKKQIYEKYNFNFNEKLTICAPIQLYEERLMDKESAMVEFDYLCRQLSTVQSCCLLSLHPRMERSLYEEAAKKYNIQIAQERLSDILPAADLFLAGFSSTVQWAVLCHIPTIILDFYDYNERIYQELRGVLLVDKGEFLSSLEELLNDQYMYDRMVKANSEQANLYSPFDGKCVERIVDIIRYPKKHLGEA